jgi:hypothetical protein
MRTIGGLPDTEALHWDNETYQQFGTIVYQLSSHDAELRRRGYRAFYEFRRHFIEVEFLEMINRLEAFRRDKHITPLDTLLKDIRGQILSIGHILPAVSTPVAMPIPATVLMARKPVAVAATEGEQLSFL